jgi:hypothetical protein
MQYGYWRCLKPELPQRVGKPTSTGLYEHPRRQSRSTKLGRSFWDMYREQRDALAGGFG